MSYRIGSFNLRNIGFNTLGNDNPRNIGKIAEIIKKEKFDVVALQEVLSEGKALFYPDYAKKSLLMELGSGWDFRWADVGTQRADPRGEGYAFIWNTHRLRLSTTERIDGAIRTFNPIVCDISKKDMSRRPFYARLTPAETLVGGPWVEFRLLCVHTYFGKDNKEDRKKRQNELDILMKEIYPKISDRRYGLLGNGMPSYTLIMGDYNVILWRPWKDEKRIAQNLKRHQQGKSALRKPAVLVADENDEVEFTRWGKRRVKTVQYEPTTLCSEGDDDNKDSDGDRGYANDYDHFSYEERQFVGTRMKVKRIDAVRKYYRDDFSLYRKEVSDHIPIMMEIELNEYKDI